MSRPATAGPDQPGAVEDRRVEAHRVGQQLRADHLRDERLPDRRVDRRRPRPAPPASTKTCHSATPPVATRSAEHQREDAHQRLGDDEQPALVVAVGEHAAVHAQQQGGAELQRGDQAERDAAVVGELQHQPVLADALHPGAGQADQVGRGEEPVVAHPQRAERARARVRGAASVSARAGHPPASLSMIAAASRSTARSSAVSSCSRPVSQASRARASASSSSSAAGGQADDDLPAVGRVRRAGDQAHALERDDDAGHRRRLDPLVRGELAGAHRPVPLERGQRGQVGERDRRCRPAGCAAAGRTA